MDEPANNASSEPTGESPRAAVRKCSPEVRRIAEEIFREHGSRIYNIARRMLPTDADAEDVTQEVLVQVVRNLEKFRGESSLTTWLHRITVNAALQHRRTKQRRANRETEHVLVTVEDKLHVQLPARRWKDTPVGQALDQELQQQINKAIAELPETYRDPFVLADLQGMSGTEVAELLEISVPALKSRLHRARLMLRDALAPYCEEVTA